MRFQGVLGEQTIAAERKGGRRWTPGRLTMPRSGTLEFALASDEAWSIGIGRRAIQVRCLSGQLLVTVEGDPEDHVLGPGDVFSARTRGRLLAMMPLRPARIAVSVGAGRGRDRIVALRSVLAVRGRRRGWRALVRGRGAA